MKAGQPAISPEVSLARPSIGDDSVHQALARLTAGIDLHSRLSCAKLGAAIAAHAQAASFETAVADALAGVTATIARIGEDCRRHAATCLRNVEITCRPRYSNRPRYLGTPPLSRRPLEFILPHDHRVH